MPEIKALRRITSAIERADVLDRFIALDTAAVRFLARPRALRQLLHGVPFGHPVHPLLVQVPLGAWISAGVLDLAPGRSRAAETLVGVGIGSAGVAATAGFVDWSELDREQQRTGWVHAMVNFTAMTLYGVSWWQRRSGGTGKLAGLAGLVVVSAGGYLGGHLTYRQRGGVSRAGEVPFDGV